MYPTAVIMLGLDDHDDAVVGAVISLASRLGLERAVVVHVVQQDAARAALGAGAASSGKAVQPELERQVDVLRAALPDVEWSFRVETGGAVDELDTLSTELKPDLLVVGRSLFVGGKTAWGHTAHAMVRHARCASLVVPRGWRPPAQGAVVGIDFSDESTDALKTAACLFPEVVCVHHFDPRVSGSGAVTEAEFTDELQRNATRHFDEDVRSQVPSDCVSDLELIADSSTTDALLTRAGSTHMVVIGSRGLSPLAAMLLGSTAEKVAGRANVPVLITRSKGHVMGLIEGLFHR